MTVIAYDGNYFAADRMSSYGGLVNELSKIKVHHGLSSKVVYAFNGPLDYAMQVYKYFKNERDRDDKISWPDFQNNGNEYAQVVKWNNGRIFTYDRVPYPVEFEDEFLAWGSGSEVAIGAMAAGKDAVEAVKIACHYINNCGKGIDVVDLKTFEQYRISEKELYN